LKELVQQQFDLLRNLEGENTPMKQVEMLLRGPDESIIQYIRRISLYLEINIDNIQLSNPSVQTEIVNQLRRSIAELQLEFSQRIKNSNPLLQNLLQSFEPEFQERILNGIEQVYESISSVLKKIPIVMVLNPLSRRRNNDQYIPLNNLAISPNVDIPPEIDRFDINEFVGVKDNPYGFLRTPIRIAKQIYTKGGNLLIVVGIVSAISAASTIFIIYNGQKVNVNAPTPQPIPTPTPGVTPAPSPTPKPTDYYPTEPPHTGWKPGVTATSNPVSKPRRFSINNRNKRLKIK